jgi:hypothetical protein
MLTTRPPVPEASMLTTRPSKPLEPRLLTDIFPSVSALKTTLKLKETSLLNFFFGNSVVNVYTPNPKFNQA